MKFIPIKMPLIQKGDDIIAIFLNVLHNKGLKLEDGDIVAFADKIAAISEGRVINFEYVEPSEEAKALAERYVLEPGFVEVVLREADEIFGGVIRALLTVKNDIIIANAGMDHKNAPVHSATMWPSNPQRHGCETAWETGAYDGKTCGRPPSG